MDYNLIKAFHLLSVFAWLAGLFYLPRLFVYHSMVEKYSLRSETFKIMERRLLNIIMYPSMFFSWFFGIYLIYKNSDLIYFYWFWIKIISVIIMTIFQFYCSKIVHLFEKDMCDNTDKFFRILNEIPTVLLIIIVFMVTIQPLQRF